MTRRLIFLPQRRKVYVKNLIGFQLTKSSQRNLVEIFFRVHTAHNLQLLPSIDLISVLSATLRFIFLPQGRKV